MKKLLFCLIALIGCVYAFACDTPEPCQGHTVEDESGALIAQSTCTLCYGHGTMREHITCSTCSGAGTRSNTTTSTCASCSGRGAISTKCTASGCNNGQVTSNIACRRPTWTTREFAGNCTVCSGGGTVRGRDPRTNYAPVRCTAAGCESGRLYANVVHVCSTCNGSGNHGSSTHNCNTCHGSGSISRTCTICSGGGSVTRTNTVNCGSCINGLRTTTVLCNRCGGSGNT